MKALWVALALAGCAQAAVDEQESVTTAAAGTCVQVVRNRTEIPFDFGDEVAVAAQCLALRPDESMAIRTRRAAVFVYDFTITQGICTCD